MGEINWNAATTGAVFGAAFVNQKYQREIIRQQQITNTFEAEQARLAFVRDLDAMVEELEDRGASSTAGDEFVMLSASLNDLATALGAVSVTKDAFRKTQISYVQIHSAKVRLEGFADTYFRVGQALDAKAEPVLAESPESDGVGDWALSRYAAAWERLETLRKRLADDFRFHREAPFATLIAAFPHFHPISFLALDRDGRPRALKAPKKPIQPAEAGSYPDPGWYPDPVGRFELRYWDGDAWTKQVSNQGNNQVDRLKPPK